MVAVAVSSVDMKLTPRTVTTVPPDVTEFVSLAWVTTGESKVYIDILVPTVVVTVSAAVRPVPPPYGLLHMIFVFEVHDVVWHIVFPTITVGVGASPPKLKPYKVTLEPAVGTRFAGVMMPLDVTMGAS
jgi:hypothetical protein